MTKAQALILKTIVFEIKDAEKGEIEAVVATLNVVDKDGDVILPGAIADGTKVAMSAYGHDAVWGNAPVGKGRLNADGDRIIFKGRVFLAIDRGRETFELLKEMGPDQQWSFGFLPLGSEIPDDEWRKQGARRMLTKLDSFEVSPVIIGAGVDTGTVSVKDAPDPAAIAAEAARFEAVRIAAEAEESRARSAKAASDRDAAMDRRFAHPPAGVRAIR